MLGQSINHYKITAKLGEGGMGVVYQATDTRLGREVALKILPEKFVEDRQRMNRFQREAEVLASLNHPHISIIHGLEEADGVRALVLELVEGPTLAERIAEGHIPVEETLQIALEITQALEAAHEKGIIHRDLKPANVKITPEGKVKVLDFGLAKALEPELSQQELANSPTLTLEATQEGIVLGTAAYMSPEQARGQTVDKRTDIWSFGLLFFEMLTGKSMYAGRSLTETLAAVIHGEPVLENLPRGTHPRIKELLRRCLRKEPRMRLRDMGDARITIDECLAGEETLDEPLVPLMSAPLWRRLVPWALVPIMLILAWAFRPLPPGEPVMRWEIPLAEGEVFKHFFRQAIALSPDGRRVAYVASLNADPSEDRTPRIYTRLLDRWKPVALPGTEGATMLFFSPDGKWLGFYSRSDRALKKLPLAGGEATTICDCRQPFGASWSADDTIVFSCLQKDGLWRVSAVGGKPEQITHLDREAKEETHRLPHMLPGGKAVLFTTSRHSTYDLEKGEIAVQVLETGERKVLVERASDGRYLSTGHLLFARVGTLMAAPFDLASLELTGPEVRVLEGVSHGIHTGGTGWETGSAQFAVSSSGTLAYIGGSVFPETRRQVVWVDRSGRVEPTRIEPGQYYSLRLSPDEGRVIVSNNYKGDIWVWDLARGTSTRQTTDQGSSGGLWTPGGTRFSFISLRGGQSQMLWKAVDSDEEAEALFPSEKTLGSAAWSPDGKHLAVLSDPLGNPDIWILSMEGSRSIRPFRETPFYEGHPVFSPNGQWLAYSSNESGRAEVYGQPFPGPGPKTIISTSGGTSPTWRGDGRELFYRSGPRMMAVKISVDGGELKPGIPMFLFEGSYKISYPTRGYDVRRDGKRFLMQTVEPEKDLLRYREYFGNRVNIVLKWSEEVKRLAPTG